MENNTKQHNISIVFGKRSFKKFNKIYVNEEDLEIPHGDDYKIALDELKKIVDSKLHGKNFLNHFEFGSDSLWWFIFPSTIPVYKKIINFIISFQELIQKENPSNIVVEENFEFLNIIKQICVKNEIKISYSKFKASRFLLKQKLLEKIQKIRFSKITNTKISERKNLFQKNIDSKVFLQDKIVFAIPTAYRRRIFDYSSGESKSGEYIQDSLMNLLKNESIVGIDIDYTFKGDLKKSSERLHDFIPWIPIESLVLDKKYQSQNNFLKNYANLLTDTEFQNLFTFNNIKLWENVKETFQKMSYAPNLPLHISLIESLLLHFKKDKPKTVFLPYETGPYALSIITACKIENIQTIGVSHAFISKNMPMYSHYSCKSKSNPLGHPIPDNTLVFGNFAKKILIDAGYPDTQVTAFGNPAFFNLKKLQDSLTKTQPKKKYQIKNNQKIILFTSGKLQPKYVTHGNYDYDVQIWNKLIEKFANNKNYFLILKPHPSETDVSVYQEAVQQFNAKNTLILNGDLFELLFISDIVVSVYSTTMLDAICFEKPVIQVKFKNETHPIPFEKYGVVLTSSTNNLHNSILQIFSNDEIKNDLHKNRIDFLSNQYGIPEDNPEGKIKDILNLI